MKTIFIALVTAVATFLGTTLYYDYNTANPTVHIGDYSYTINPMTLTIEAEADMNGFLNNITSSNGEVAYLIDLIENNSEIVIDDVTGNVSLEVRDDSDNVIVTVNYVHLESGVDVGPWSTLTPSKF